MNLNQYVRSHRDFPKPGVTFWDFSPLLADPAAFATAIDGIARHYRDKGITKISAIEAKGFTLGAALAYSMRLPPPISRKLSRLTGRINVIWLAG